MKHKSSKQPRNFAPRPKHGAFYITIETDCSVLMRFIEKFQRSQEIIEGPTVHLSYVGSGKSHVFDYPKPSFTEAMSFVKQAEDMMREVLRK